MSIRYILRKSIGKSYRIPRYITDRQNYIGFTYNLPIFIYSVVTADQFVKCLFLLLFILSKKSFNYSIDFNLQIDSTAHSPTKKSVFYLSDDEGEMWQENLLTTWFQDVPFSSNIFVFLESQRAVLEEKIGSTTLMKVYKMI